MRRCLGALVDVLATCRIDIEFNSMFTDDGQLDSPLLMDERVHQILSTN